LGAIRTIGTASRARSMNGKDAGNNGCVGGMKIPMI
jgi:hypothetical protein